MAEHLIRNYSEELLERWNINASLIREVLQDSIVAKTEFKKLKTSRVAMKPDFDTESTHN